MGQCHRKNQPAAHQYLLSCTKFLKIASLLSLCLHVMMVRGGLSGCMWGPEDTFMELVLSFPSGSWGPNSDPCLVLLPTKTSHWLYFLKIIFVKKMSIHLSLLFCFCDKHHDQKQERFVSSFRISGTQAGQPCSFPNSSKNCLRPFANIVSP